MTQRDPDLQNLFDAIKAVALAHPVGPDGTAERMFGAFDEVRPASTPEAKDLPVCEHIPAALDETRSGPTPLPAMADAFANVAKRLHWWARPGAEDHGPAFAAGHANATLAGPGGPTGGLEVRRDLTLGVTLMAPELTYPDHHHLPEEIYVVMSGGEWRQKQNPWHAIDVGGTHYNPHDILHAMRSGPVPLLAVWCLWDADLA